MAININNNQLQQEDNQPNNTVASPTAPNPQQAQQPAQPKPLLQPQNQQKQPLKKGTGFTNLNRVMQASRGNTLGQAVAGGVAGQAQKAQEGIKTAQQRFEEQAQKARLDTDEAKQARAGVLNKFDMVDGKAPTAMPTEQEIQDFTKYRTGTYTGPAELEDSTSLYGQAAQTEALGGLAKSSGGREELLKRFVGGKDYTSGQRTLDKTLLGQDTNSGLGAAARQTRGITSDVERANIGASEQAREYANRATEFGKETTGMLEDKRNPISTKVDEQLTSYKTQEESRLQNVSGIQDILTGQNPDYAGLDKITRLGLGLQQAKDAGYLSDSDVAQMMGEGGVIQRGMNLGLDVNSLIQERMKSNIAQGLTRSGAADEGQRASLNALDRLSGKVGPDVEFERSQDKYTAGSVGFDVSGLEKYIKQTEDERAVKDAAYADKLAAERARYLNQAQAGAERGLSGVGQVAEAAFNNAMAPLNMIADPGAFLEDPLSGVKNTNAIIQGAGDVALGGAQTMSQGQNALYEGLLKLNIGGNSIANTAAGKQLLKAIELKSKLENETLGVANKGLSSVTGGISDLTKGNLGSALGQLSGFDLAKDLNKQFSTNIQNEVGTAFSKVGLTAPKINLKVPKKLKKIKISDENLKENISYDPADVQKFLDRIKPASYDYKAEVKNDPRASKFRQLGIMAQDLEKSKLGKEAVINTEEGKVVDYDNLEPKMMASLAALNQRLKKLEKK